MAKVKGYTRSDGTKVSSHERDIDTKGATPPTVSTGKSGTTPQPAKNNNKNILLDGETVSPTIPSSYMYEDFLSKKISDNIVITPALEKVAEDFDKNGKQLYMVGGSVRDAVLGEENHDLDLTTDATPDEIFEIVSKHSKSVWDVGREYGTIAFQDEEMVVEITTFRADSYDGVTRKPTVKFGDNLADDLKRRDFTVNSIAYNIVSRKMVDPYGGARDLSRKILKTPGNPDTVFYEDPLRLLRAARFGSRLEAQPTRECLAAMENNASGIEKISVERVHDELEKIFSTKDPLKAMKLLEKTKVLKHVAPEIEAESYPTLEKIQKDPGYHDAPVELGMSACFVDSGTSVREARECLDRLRFTKEQSRKILSLVASQQHLESVDEFDDSVVRKFCHDNEGVVKEAIVLSSSNNRINNSETFVRKYEALKVREDLDHIAAELAGKDIVSTLGVKPGPIIGQAQRFLLDLRIKEGVLGSENVKKRILEWHSKNT